MELKDSGDILRSLADRWERRLDGKFYPEDWNAAMKYCGKVLTDHLDKCDVPELEPESTE